ncbi:MAG: protoporphyrinogen oxidase [Sandaracinaceae bacterium]|nr:protoporphyrinogen oxidase [Sandaracinaceae bacterium]
MKKQKVLVAGAGVSGLAAALRLEELCPEASIAIWEASPRVGGWIGTEVLDARELGSSYKGPLVVDLGPDSIVREEGKLPELIERLGLLGRIVETRKDRHGAYVVYRGRLTRVPRGFGLVGPGDPWAWLKEAPLSMRGRLRALAEPWIRPRPALARERGETLASFVRRRFGWELFEQLAEPLAAGIYGVGGEAIAIQATLPRFVEMEKTEGSVLLGLRKAQRSASKTEGARYGLFASFDLGMGVLIDACSQKLKGVIHLNRPIFKLEREGHGFIAVDERKESERFDAVIMATGARKAAGPLAALDLRLSELMGSIGHGSAVTVTMVWRREEIPHPLDAYGFVVPRVEGRRILASTWSSEKWPNRAPPDLVLIRVFCEGKGIDGRDDDLFVFEARRELADLMGITAPPRWSKVVRHEQAMPVYGPFHMKLRAQVEEILKAQPGLGLASNSLWGVGIPQAIRAGERAAERVSRHLKGLPPLSEVQE